MLLTLEHELQLRIAQQTSRAMNREQLLEALEHSWQLLLAERQSSSTLLTDALGVEVSVAGPLLPPTLRGTSS